MNLISKGYLFVVIFVCKTCTWCPLLASQPPQKVNIGGTIECSPKIDVCATIISGDEQDDDDLNSFFSDRYTLLSNSFHQMLEDGHEKLSEGRLQFFLSSAQDFEHRAMVARNAYWLHQFKVLGNSVQVALEIARAEKEIEEAKKDRDAHKASH